KRVIDRIVLPLQQYIKRYRLKVVDACCSLPEKLIARFEP
ncbi:MAG: radical SAM protein, partial [Thermoprotei archaeon]